MLKDQYDRVHDYLRLSLTDKCNFRCFYCMPSENMNFLPEKHLMSREEINRIVQTFVDYGVRKLRFTGGEPLVRKDAAGIIRDIAQFPVELAITTNGVLLDRYFDLFKEVGLRSLNISIDSVSPDKFHAVTQRNSFEKVWGNILRGITEGFSVKLNVVVMRGVNDDEINQMVALTERYPVHVRFIEFMPFNGNQWEYDKVVSYQEILDKVRSVFPAEKLEDKPHSTSKGYAVPGYAGTFSVISSVTAPFCHDCNRLRLTAEGKMRNCLFGTEEGDLLTKYRNGEDIRPVIERMVRIKAFQRGGLPEFQDEALKGKISERTMTTIGG